eukprot:m.28781 g.28781  ORF g.28781 m.28781 type:complete len:52 (-) comp13640_c0_seq1:3-158(-)
MTSDVAKLALRVTKCVTMTVSTHSNQSTTTLQKPMHHYSQNIRTYLIEHVF